jgi:hypothetical protein
MRIDQLGPRLQDFGIRSGKALFVETLQPRDLGVLGGDQRLPVEGAFADRPAESGGVLKMFVILRGIDEQLLRNATSAIATFFPSAAATRALRTPPEPPPMTKRS